MRTRILGAFALFGLCACAVNGFDKFYLAAPRYESARVEPFTGEPAIYSYSSDPKADILRAQEDGYLPLGTSSFYGPSNTMTKNQLVAQAKKVGASLVLVHSQYKDTLSGVVPYTVANPTQVSTVNTTGTVNAYGSGGYATGTYSGQSTIMTPGGTTTYALPYSVNRNDVVATFWAHQDPRSIRLGIVYVPLPDAVRTKLQRNTGVFTAGIIRGTPAFNANILREDVILKMGGEDVVDWQGFDQQLKKFAGQTVDIELIRGDTPKKVTVTLNPGPRL
jgi:membrane-associated protease RseP (regulator of RpoE activity)